MCNMKNTITAKRLKELRQQKGVSQEEVAKFLNVERTTYTAYESGKSRPVRYLDKLSSYFDVSSDYILGLVDSPSLKEIKFETLSDLEKQLIIDYWKLNDAGKEKLISYSRDLLEIPSYTKKEKSVAV